MEPHIQWLSQGAPRAPGLALMRIEPFPPMRNSLLLTDEFDLFVPHKIISLLQMTKEKNESIIYNMITSFIIHTCKGRGLFCLEKNVNKFKIIGTYLTFHWNKQFGN